MEWAEGLENLEGGLRHLSNSTPSLSFQEDPEGRGANH